jgi:hypothetical protein
VAASRAEREAVGKPGRAEPEQVARHIQDETPLQTTPHRCRTGQRKGQPPTVPGGGTTRRVTGCGRVAALGRGRSERVRAAQDRAPCARDRDLREAHHQALRREISRVRDHGSAHPSHVRLHALLARREGLHVIWLAM